MAATSDKERLVIDLNHNTMGMLDDLVGRTGASSRAEFFRNLLSLAEVTVKNIEKENDILLEDQEGVTSKSNFEYILMRK